MSHERSSTCGTWGEKTKDCCGDKLPLLCQNHPATRIGLDGQCPACKPKDSTEALKCSDREKLVIAVEALQSLTRALAQSNEEWLKATLKMTLEAIGPLDGSSK